MMLNDLNRRFFNMYFSIYEIPRTGSTVKCQIHIDTAMRNIRSCQAVTSLHRPWNYPGDYKEPIQSKFPLEASELLDHHDGLVNSPKLMHDISWANPSIITHTTKNHYGYKELTQTVPMGTVKHAFSTFFWDRNRKHILLLCLSISSFLDSWAESNSISYMSLWSTQFWLVNHAI